MTTKYVMTWVLSAALLSPMVALAAEDSDADRAHPENFVQDSAITARIKTKLMEEHFANIATIHVDTDRDGVVWLSGRVHSEDQREMAGKIARHTEGVRAVHNDIAIKKDD